MPTVDALRVQREGFKHPICYMALLDDRGWCLAIAEEDTPGYWATTWPPAGEAEVKRYAAEANLALGLTDRRVAEIIASTMRGTGRRGRRAGGA